MATGKFNLPITTTSVTTQAITGYTVRFIDIDGTVLKSEVVAQGGSATAPSNPNYDPDYLTFDSWNNDYTNILYNLDVGAIYNTIDLYTIVKINVPVTGYTPQLWVNGSSEIYINWGDGNTQSSIAGIISKASGPYSQTGNYIISISGATYFGDGGSANRFMSTSTGNTYINKIYFSSSIIEISPYSLRDYSNLEVISLGKNITKIGSSANSSYAFFGCTSLLNANIPYNVSVIGAYSFNSCWKLKSSPLRKSFYTDTTFGPRVYDQCYQLTYLNPVQGSQYIFTNGAALKKFWNYLSVNNLTNAFSYAYFLTDLYFTYSNGTTFPNYVFDGCTNLQNVYDFEKLPITSMGISCFNNCYSLKNITIPSGVTSISSTCFYKCSGLEWMVFSRTTPPTITTTTLSNTAFNVKIYVPDDSVNTYKTATNWTVYASKIYPISQKPS